MKRILSILTLGLLLFAAGAGAADPTRFYAADTCLTVSNLSAASTATVLFNTNVVRYGIWLATTNTTEVSPVIYPSSTATNGATVTGGIMLPSMSNLTGSVFVPADRTGKGRLMIFVPSGTAGIQAVEVQNTQ